MVILFDLDGTLIDSTEAIVESFYYAYEKMNNKNPPKKEMIKSLIGYPLDVMFEKNGISKEQKFEYVDRYKENYKKISTQKTVLLPHAKEAVLMAKEIATLAIVTTKTGKYSKVLMQHFDLMKYFDVLIGYEDVKNPKPSSEPILKALDELNKNIKDDVWMIGDTILDIQAANKAKINSIGVLSGYDSKELLLKFTKNIEQNVEDAIKYLKFK